MILHECFVRNSHCIIHLTFRRTRFRKPELVAAESRVSLDIPAQRVAVGKNSIQSQQNVLQSQEQRQRDWL